MAENKVGEQVALPPTSRNRVLIPIWVMSNAYLFSDFPAQPVCCPRHGPEAPAQPIEVERTEKTLKKQQQRLPGRGWRAPGRLSWGQKEPSMTLTWTYPLLTIFPLVWAPSFGGRFSVPKWILSALAKDFAVHVRGFNPQASSFMKQSHNIFATVNLGGILVLQDA